MKFFYVNEEFICGLIDEKKWSENYHKRISFTPFNKF